MRRPEALSYPIPAQSATSPNGAFERRGHKKKRRLVLRTGNTTMAAWIRIRQAGKHR